MSEKNIIESSQYQSEQNRMESEEASLVDMCSWGELD